MFGVYIFLVAIFFRDSNKQNHEMADMNQPHWYALVGIALQLMGIGLSLAHNWSYSYDGEGLVICDILSTIFDVLSECVMTLLVLMLAKGWFTRFTRFNFDDGFDEYGPWFMINIIVHVIFGAMTFVDRDAHHKYHDFGGWQGACIIVLKLALIGAFYYFWKEN